MRRTGRTQPFYHDNCNHALTVVKDVDRGGKQQGLNHLPRTLTTTPYDLLRAIKRSTGAHDYQELQAALLRLRTTFITTSIPATKRRQTAGFNWLDSLTFDTETDTGQPRGMTLTLSDWVYEGIVNEKSLLTMHPDYGMELEETADRSPAVQFKRRGKAETLALAEKMRAEEERCARFDADRRRTEEMDARIDKLAGRC